MTHIDIDARFRDFGMSEKNEQEIRKECKE